MKIFQSLTPFLLMLAVYTPLYAKPYVPTEGFMLDSKEAAPMVIKKYGTYLREACDEFQESCILAITILIIETHGALDATHNSSATGLMGVKPNKALADVRRLYPKKHFHDD